MDLNKILKLVIIIAILIIAVSAFYYYVIHLPQLEKKQQKQAEEKKKQEQLLSYKLEFQKECDKKYDEIEKEFKERLFVGLFSEEMCKEKIDWFDIDSFVFCKDGTDYEHTRETYIPACIDWKMEQVGITEPNF